MTRNEFEERVAEWKARAAELRQEIATAQAEGRFKDIAAFREELSHIQTTARIKAAEFHHNRLHALNQEIDAARGEERQAELELKRLRRVWSICFEEAANTIDTCRAAKADCLETYRDDEGVLRSTVYEYVKTPLEKCRGEMDAVLSRYNEARRKQGDARNEIKRLGYDGGEFVEAVIQQIEAEAETAEAEAV